MYTHIHTHVRPYTQIHTHIYTLTHIHIQSHIYTYILVMPGAHIGSQIHIGQLHGRSSGIATGIISSGFGFRSI